MVVITRLPEVEEAFDSQHRGEQPRQGKSFQALALKLSNPGADFAGGYAANSTKKQVSCHPTSKGAGFDACQVK